MTSHSNGIRFASWAAQSTRFAMQEMLARSNRPGVLSLALGLPAADLFPAAEVANAYSRVLGEDPRALQYQASSALMVEQVIGLMRRRGVNCEPSQVILTAGGQQGMSLVLQALVDAGDVVAIEDRTYPGFIQALEPYAPRLAVIPSSARTGIDLDAFEASLMSGARPKLLYTMSDGHNPLGVSLSCEARERLVALARAHEVPIVEDDAYGLLRYDEDSPPALRAFDADWVIYVGSFSKLLAPALRVGWIVAPPKLATVLANLKDGVDLNTSSLAQRAVLSLLADGVLDAHVARLCTAYRQRRDTLNASLVRYFTGIARWSVPPAGMFIWVDLDPALNTTELLGAAIESHGVCYMPSEIFCAPVGPRIRSGMRLNFTHCTPRLLDEAVCRLRACIDG